MKLIAIIEKGSDERYSIRTGERIGNFCPGGYGDSVSEAKKDFNESINEALELISGKLSKDDIEVEYHFDMQSFFNYFDFFNTSKLAAYLGINDLFFLIFS